MTSEIKVNNIKKASGSSITIGESGDTITLASGASQSGFGRSGSVDWQTAIKTANFTATNGEGYFVDTSSGAVTVTLPASPTVGNIVSISDYAKTASTNNITIGRNGSNIDGGAIDLTLNNAGIAVTLIYADSTKGWKPVNSNEVTAGPKFISATGGTITTVCTNFKVHTFTAPGTFCVSCAGNPAGSSTVSYMVVAGGGGASTVIEAVGGAGAGGFREGRTPTCSYTVSPLNAPAGLPVSKQGYSITVGAGGAGASGQPCQQAGGSGGTSTFSSITSAGGGGGGGFKFAGAAGGSGGGAGGRQDFAGGAGNTPPVSPPQGNAGGNSNTPNNGPEDAGGGGGGATAVGTAGTTPIAGTGGAGATTSINGSATAFAGGGGGASQGGTKGPGGAGGGGNGGQPGVTSEAGTTNTGGGAGGGSTPQEPDAGAGKNGGSGIVIIRYKFQ